MAEYTKLFEEIGLVKNEARIYETLLKEGESGVGHISTKSGVHRRNVYDTLDKLIDKGLVFERISSTEHLYTGVDPQKLLELVREKEQKIANVLPDLKEMYNSKPHTDEVVVYKGIEGWKNHLRDIITVGQDVYSIGAKGTWQDERLRSVRKQLVRESENLGIKNYWLFDPKLKGKHEEYVKEGFDAEYRYLPPEHDTKTAIDIFGDRVVIVTDPNPEEVIEDFSVTVLINQHTADSFRTWFNILWEASS